VKLMPHVGRFTVVALLIFGGCGSADDLKKKACAFNERGFCGPGMWCQDNPASNWSICLPIPADRAACAGEKHPGECSNSATDSGVRPPEMIGGSGGRPADGGYVEPGSVRDGATTAESDGLVGGGGGAPGGGTNGGTDSSPPSPPQGQDASPDTTPPDPTPPTSPPTPPPSPAPPSPPGCVNACTLSQQRCGGGGLQTCQVGPSGCRVWGPAEPCPAPQVCPIGATSCQCPSPDTCPSEAAQRCSLGSEQRCLRDGACLRWGPPSSCPVGQTCSTDGARCECPTDTTCSAGARRCTGAGLQTCSANGVCFSWSVAVACMTPQTCQGNAPSAGCACPSEDACSANGVRECVVGNGVRGPGVRTCTRRGRGSCLVWELTDICDYKGCSDSRCNTTCPIGTIDTGSGCERGNCGFRGMTCCANMECYDGSSCAPRSPVPFCVM
jgi:hypothetical protein